MGNAKSKTNFNERFDLEAKLLKAVLDEIININGFTKNGEYTISHETLCEKFTYVMEKNLHKHQH
jgi:uncharacterized protein YifE (UPF0438 family)